MQWLVLQDQVYEMPIEFGKLKVVGDFGENYYYKKNGSQRANRNEMYGCVRGRAEVTGNFRNC